MLGSLATVGLIFALVLLLARKPGDTVVVSVSGKTVKTFPLSVNTTYTITGKDGGSNTLIIENGYARIEEASCPDGLCKNMGKINITGQSIICLPNEVVITIESKDKNEIDIVVQ